MIDNGYPQDANGKMKVKEVISTTGLLEWVDYIPVQIVTDAGATAEYKSDNDGNIPAIRR